MCVCVCVFVEKLALKISGEDKEDIEAALEDTFEWLGKSRRFTHLNRLEMFRARGGLIWRSDHLCCPFWFERAALALYRATAEYR